ncbi:hypothetical protein, partial [Burkholderia cenocepacia]|uniref:hypothetical protein n=2 Tax=Burkholderia cenocepacia TaxID=95486 RepID=UPI0011CEF328
MHDRLIEDRSSSTQRRSNDETEGARAKPGEAMMALAAWWRGAGYSAPEFDTAVGYLAALTEHPILIEAQDAGGVQRFPSSWTEDQAGWKSPLRIPASEMRALSDPRADQLEQLMDMVHKGLSTRQEAIPQEWPE